MKRYYGCIAVLLMVSQSVLPVLKLIALFFGWQLSVLNGLAFAVPMAVVSVTAAAIYIKGKGDADIGKCECFCTSIALPLSLIDFLILPAFQSVAMVVATVVNCLGCLAIYLCCRGSKGLRKFTTIAAVALTVAVVGVSLLHVVFSDFGITEVVRSEASPDGTYTANVINIDQGALGGDSVVRVQRLKLFGIPLDDVVCLDRRVWLGDWGTTHLIGMHWVDDDTLMIEGEEQDFH